MKCPYQIECRTYQAHPSLCWMRMSKETRARLGECPVAEEYHHLELVVEHAEIAGFIPTEAELIETQRGARI